MKVDGPLSSNDGSTVLSWALKGRGIAVRSQWETAKHLADGSLVALLGNWAQPNADIHAIYLERHGLRQNYAPSWSFSASACGRPRCLPGEASLSARDANLLIAYHVANGPSARSRITS